jgi:ubiquinone/menaquinone biosynthesis C-methylase UbiE
MAYLTIVGSVALTAWLVTQCRKPNGPLGRVVLTAMNVGHSGLTDWGLGKVPIREDDTILDVGCGGGRTVQKLAAMAPNGRIFGVDYSKASVAASRRRNASDIARGHVSIEEASVAALPFGDRTFDIVSAVETHYYWPDLLANFAEVRRVLKPGGTILLIAETFREGRSAGATGAVMRMLRGKLLTLDEHRDLLTRAGFADVSTSQMPGKPWMCAVGRRPS